MGALNPLASSTAAPGLLSRTETRSLKRGPVDRASLILGRAMSSPADGVYFSAPGVASVRWDEGDQLVLVEWDAGRTPSSSRRCSKPSCAHSSSMGAPVSRRLPPTEGPPSKGPGSSQPRVAAARAEHWVEAFCDRSARKRGRDMNLRDSMEKASGAGLDVEYFATVEEARDWVVA